MANIEDMIYQLKNERSSKTQELSQLNRAIQYLSRLSLGPRKTSRTSKSVSAATRLKISKAQRLRWAEKRKKAKAKEKAPAKD